MTTKTTAEQAKAQLIELIQVRLADFIKERMYEFIELHQEEDEDGFFYEAVKQMGWTGNKVDLDELDLSVRLSVCIQKEDEYVSGDDDHDVCVSYVTIHLTPSICVEDPESVPGSPTGLSNQRFRGCGSMSLDLRVA